MTTFPEYVEDYLRVRRALGYKLVEPGRTLPRFAAHLEASGTEFVTVDAALAWALEPDVPHGSVVRPMRMLVVRGFARYMTGIDPRTEIPPPACSRSASAGEHHSSTATPTLWS